MLDERLIARFLLEAPFLPGAADLGVLTCPVDPWPHQLRVVREVVRRFPESFLFCDEVGLGKTIEAGLALRQLVLSGRVRRALLLVPGALVKQWQEELHEKLSLDVPRFEKGRFRTVRGEEAPGDPGAENPWDRHPLVLVSSHLARRRERWEELLAARPWDLVLVDEAHHARRRGFRSGDREPNRLLALLAGTRGRPGLKDRTRSLYLLTATPMQVHPLEIWDLLRLLGLGGHWGGREEDFLGYFESLRQPFGDRDWDRLLVLWGESLRLEGGIDPQIRQRGRESLGEATWQQVEALADAASARGEGTADPEALRARALAVAVEDAARPWVDGLLRHHTPIRRFAWRGTRELLRSYHRRGWLAAPVPERRPQNVWIPMRAEERELYGRIEEYVSEVYQRCEARRRGLGFVMTIYRRRLTSSFAAVRRSLERRLERLGGGETSTEPEWAEEDLAAGSERVLEAFTEELGEGRGAESSRDLFLDPEQEKTYLRTFLRDLEGLPADSKLERLRRDLEQRLPEWKTALVFTQYTDTLDTLRNALREDYGNGVATYSGRGGEVWNGSAWVPCDKERLKAAFRAGAGAGTDGDEGPSVPPVRILVSTDAASEGLNLQTCGLMINFDMPWNPMRVEQRIGRLDRIGQTHSVVEILNYFYEETVEAQIYQRLGDRIRWFEQVVGTLQPILRQVGESIEKIAMVSPPRRESMLAETVRELRQELSEPPDPEAVELKELFDGLGREPEDRDGPGVAALTAPVSAEQIERFVLGAPSLGPLFDPDPELTEAFVWTWRQRKIRVTFSPRLFDRHPYSLELLTYGHPLFYALLESLASPPSSEEPQGLGLYRTEVPVPVSLFLAPSRDGFRPVTRLEDLRAELLETRWRGQDEGLASSLFSRERQRELQHMEGVLAGRRLDRRRAAIRSGREILVRAALVELERLRTPGLFEPPLPHGHGRRAVEYLARHGEPFSRLLELVARDDVPPALATDPRAAELAGASPAALGRAWARLESEAISVVEDLAQLEVVTAEALGTVVAPSTSGLLQRSWFRAEDGAFPARETRELVPLDEVRPFANAVPFYETVDEAAERLGEPEERSQEAARQHPGGYRWTGIDGRLRPATDLFVVALELRALERRVPVGSFCLFRMVAGGWRPSPGRLVLVRHRDILDPELGGSTTVRLWDGFVPQAGEWEGLRAVLRPASSDPRFGPLELSMDEGDLDLIAEMVEILP